MNKFSKEDAYKILKNEVDPNTLTKKYPDLYSKVMIDISRFDKQSNVEDIFAFIDKYKRKAELSIKKIQKSGGNQKTIEAFLPEIIQARIAIFTIEQLNLFAQSRTNSGKIRLNLWDGTILQKILFRKSFQRKPASLFLFKLFWPFITNKKILMPLVNKKGIYCFYSKELIRALKKLISNTKCLEIGAGDGTLTCFLRGIGIQCTATDNYSWGYYIHYPDWIENIGAKEALQKYNPETVICSWTPPGNTFEKNIFTTESVNLYIAIGTVNSEFSGNHDTYKNQDDFTMEYSRRLSKLILPLSKQNAVFIFRRKTRDS